MTIKITGRASSNDDNANTSVARELVQRLGERVAHLLIEMDAPCTAECNERNSIGYFCCQNIGVHWVLLKMIGGPESLEFRFVLSSRICRRSLNGFCGGTNDIDHY